MIFLEVEVSRLVEITMLMMKAQNRMSNPSSHYTMTLLVINPCAHELTLPRSNKQEQRRILKKQSELWMKMTKLFLTGY
jgi:hypothetical protein